MGAGVHSLSKRSCYVSIDMFSCRSCGMQNSASQSTAKRRVGQRQCLCLSRLSSGSGVSTGALVWLASVLAGWIEAILPPTSKCMKLRRPKEQGDSTSCVLGTSVLPVMEGIVE